MQADVKKGLIQLARSLGYIAGLLEDYRHVDEDWDWKYKSGPTQFCVMTGAKYAVANVKTVTTAIRDAEQEAEHLPNHPLVAKAKVALELATSGIGNLDVPAEFALSRGETDEAINCCRSALRKAHRLCGKRLEVLEAQLLIAAREYTTPEIPSHNRPGSDPTPSASQPWHGPEEERLSQYSFGPITGTKPQVTKWVLGRAPKKNDRGLNLKAKSGRIWVVKFDKKTFEVWFRSQSDYSAANARKISDKQ